MVQIDIDYTGELHCSAKHGPSAKTLETDAPVDNKGKGESFSPTDLVATALGTCMATTMGIVALNKDLDLRGMQITVEKEMAAAPRRISRLTVRVSLPIPLTADPQRILEKTALACPVYVSLHPEMEKIVHFVWQEESAGTGVA